MSNIKTYSVNEVAEILKVTNSTIYNYIKAGKLKAVKLGKSHIITEEALQEVFNAEATQE